MRFQTTTLLLVLLCAIFALAVAPKKSVLVTYPNGTPAHVIEAAKEEIRKAGGTITHEYNLIKGFAADVVQNAIDTIVIMGQDHNVIVEEDQVVSANGH